MAPYMSPVSAYQVLHNIPLMGQEKPFLRAEPLSRYLSAPLYSTFEVTVCGLVDPFACICNLHWQPSHCVPHLLLNACRDRLHPSNPHILNQLR